MASVAITVGFGPRCLEYTQEDHRPESLRSTEYESYIRALELLEKTYKEAHAALQAQAHIAYTAQQKKD
jgi:hypothetical protein